MECEHVQVTGYSNAEEELSGHASEVPFSVEDRIAKVRMHAFYRTCCHGFCPSHVVQVQEVPQQTALKECQ